MNVSGMNPKGLAMSLLYSKMGDSPLGKNLIHLAEEGNTAEIEKIVRNIATQNGIDYDSAFSQFKKQLGL